MSNYGETRRYSNRSPNSDSRERFRDRQNVRHNPNFSERIRPLGLIKKYPNYEPFHPPPQENFEYPEHMHPPAKKRAASEENRDSRERDSRHRRRHDSDSDDNESRNGYSKDRHSHHNHHHHHHRSSSSGRERPRRRSHSGRRRSRSRSRSHSRNQRSHRRGNSSHSNYSDRNKRNKRSESRENISEDSTVGLKPPNEYWEKTESAEDSEVDLENELHPLTHHLHDKKRLLKEALRSLKGKRLKAMIPPLIKDMEFGELERSCVDILEKLDEETVLKILDGKLAGIFDKSEEEASKVAEQVPTNKDDGAGGGKKLKNKKKTQAVLNTADDESETEGTKMAKKVTNEGGKSRSKKKKKLKEPTIPDESKVKKKKQKKKEMKEKSKKKKRKEAKKAAEEGPATGGHKSLMELLELEFRAKAIKALLRTQGVLGMDVDAALAPDESSPKSSFTASHHDLNKNPDGKSKKKSSKEVSVPGSNLKTSTPPTQVLVDEEIEAEPPDTVGQSSMDECEQQPGLTTTTLLNNLDSVSSEDEECEDSDIDESEVEEEEEEVICNEVKEKDVIGLVDEALTGQFDETLGDLTSEDNAVLEAPQILLGGCATSEIDGDMLRSKLLRNYRRRARKAKKVAEQRDIEDVLELHAEDSASSNSDQELSDDEVSLKDGEREEHSNSESEPELESGEKKEELQEEQELDKESSENLTSKEITNPEHTELEQMEEDTVAEMEEIVEEEEEVVVEEPEEGEIMSDALSNHSEDAFDLPEKDEDQRESRPRSARSWRNDRRRSHSNDSNSDPEYPYLTKQHGRKSDALRRSQSPVEYISNFDTEPISEPSSPEQRPDASSSFTNFSSRETPKTVLGCVNLPSSSSPTGNSSSAQDASEIDISNEISSNPAPDDQDEPENDDKVVANEKTRVQNGNNELEEEEDPKPITWYERWFQSKSMQKVVKTNKIQKKLRSKLKSTKPKEKVAPILEVNVDESEPIIGSIEEYEKLFGKKVPESNEQNEPSAKGKSGKTVQSDVEEEEDNDLWGDIIGDDDDP